MLLPSSILSQLIPESRIAKRNIRQELVVTKERSDDGEWIFLQMAGDLERLMPLTGECVSRPAF
jgi:hypothetical protein